MMSTANRRARLERLTLTAAALRGAVTGAFHALVDWWLRDNLG
jgi:hypothetical protein